MPKAIDTTGSVIPSEKDDSAHTSPEKTRFVGYYKPYVGSAPAISTIAQAQITAAQDAVAMKKAAVGSKSTDSASANKTMGTRKAIHGKKGTSEAGVQSIKDAGKQRTQTNQPK